MTSGIAGEFDGQTLLDEVLSVGSLEPEIICDSLMEASEVSQEDRTLVVIGGPYEQSAETPLADLHPAVAPLEERLVPADEDAEIAGGALPANMTVDEDRLFELDQKLENLNVVLANKADAAELLGLQSEVLKLGVLAKEKNDTEVDRDTPALSPQASAGKRWPAHPVVGGLLSGFRYCSWLELRAALSVDGLMLHERQKFRKRGP